LLQTVYVQEQVTTLAPKKRNTMALALARREDLPSTLP
jgi:hypothetical protein